MPGEVGPRIKSARESFRGVGMKQKDLAAMLGISSARLSNWERGDHDPDGGTVARIARFLEVSARWLLTGSSEPETEAAPPMMPTKPQPMGKLRLYNAASAGLGNASSLHEFEVEVPAILCRQDYGGLYVEGDSMEPLLRNGDIAVFQNTFEARPGWIVCATVGGEGNEEWLIKRVGQVHSGHGTTMLTLESLNPTYESITGSFTVHGRLVGYYRIEGPEHSTRYNPLGLKPLP